MCAVASCPVVAHSKKKLVDEVLQQEHAEVAFVGAALGKDGPEGKEPTSMFMILLALPEFVVSSVVERNKG